MSPYVGSRTGISSKSFKATLLPYAGWQFLFCFFCLPLTGIYGKNKKAIFICLENEWSCILRIKYPLIISPHPHSNNTSQKMGDTLQHLFS